MIPFGPRSTDWRVQEEKLQETKEKAVESQDFVAALAYLAEQDKINDSITALTRDVLTGLERRYEARSAIWSV